LWKAHVYKDVIVEKVATCAYLRYGPDTSLLVYCAYPPTYIDSRKSHHSYVCGSHVCNWFGNYIVGKLRTRRYLWQILGC
jgi:hypothetical protein